MAVTPILTYTVAYNGNGATSGSTASSSHNYGTAKNLTTNGFSRTGYEFIGWNTAANGSGTSYSDGQSVTNLSSEDGATVTLYAQWRQLVASNFEITEKDSSWNVTNVQEALDSLYK